MDVHKKGVGLLYYDIVERLDREYGLSCPNTEKGVDDLLSHRLGEENLARIQIVLLYRLEVQAAKIAAALARIAILKDQEEVKDD